MRKECGGSAFLGEFSADAHGSYTYTCLAHLVGVGSESNMKSSLPSRASSWRIT